MRFLSFLPPWLDPILPAHLDRRPKIFVSSDFIRPARRRSGALCEPWAFVSHKGFSINMPGKRVRIAEPVTLAKIQDVALPFVPY